MGKIKDKNELKIRELVKQNGGKIRSGTYENSQSEFEIECSEGHVWTNIYRSFVFDKTWCKNCTVKHPAILNTLQDCINLAAQYDGYYRSSDYMGGQELAVWECKYGHVFNKTFETIKYKKTWCLQCNVGTSKNRLPYTLEYAQSLAKAKGGVCKSTKYKNIADDLLWECKLGHEFEKNLNEIIDDRWCSECLRLETGYIIQYTIKDVRNEVENCKFKLISTEYFNVDDPLDFECPNQHPFTKSFYNFKKTNKELQCPTCRHPSEEICRYYFENIFQHKFPNTRPDFLKNDKTGRNLELDGYCTELKIAFEHNGEQHYKIKSIFHTANINDPEVISNFRKRQEYDTLKIERCKDHGVKLIIIPQLVDMLPLEDLKNFIKDQCLSLNIELPDDYDRLEFDLSKITKTDRLKIFIDILKARGDKYKSGEYINISSKLTCECKLGHEYILPCGKIPSRGCQTCSKMLNQENLKILNEKRSAKATKTLSKSQST